MKMIRLLRIGILLLCCHTTCAQTDYSQLVNWYFHPDKPLNLIGNYDLDIAVIDKDLSVDSTISITNNSETNTGLDVFWVHPTQLTNPPSTPANVSLDNQPYSIISSTIIAQGALLAKYGRFYAPRYQQASPASFLDSNYSDSARAAAILTAYNDVKAAFQNYLTNHNNGNRVILAGHSQGSFLLGMLIRDLFDNNAELRSKLLTASLGGKGDFHAAIGEYSGGQWENVPLCTTMNQCECIHTWRSFKETQDIPDVVNTLPVFNTTLVDSGLVNRNVDLTTDWFVQDSLFYNSTSTPLRYYIAPDAGYNLGGGSNFIAFDSLYTARFKRTSNTKLALVVDYTNHSDDQRPNDLLPVENSSVFLTGGFHSKDYHIYLWALMEQIDAKVMGCNTVSNVEVLPNTVDHLKVYPNPSNGAFTLEIDATIPSGDFITITDVLGRVVRKIDSRSIIQINLNHSGVYFLISKYGTIRIIVN